MDLPSDNSIQTQITDGVNLVSQVNENTQILQSVVSSVPQVQTVLTDNVMNVSSVINAPFVEVTSVNGMTGDVITEAEIFDFEANKYYRKNTLVNYEGRLYWAKEKFTSGSSFDSDDWYIVEVGDIDWSDINNKPTKLSQFTNDGDGTTGSAFATEDYVDENGGKIDVIKVNGTAQTIIDKTVDITTGDTKGSNIFYATCTTDVATAAKVATSATGDFTLTAGSSVDVYFTYANTASSPTLNVDGTGEKAMRYPNGTALPTNYWQPLSTQRFVYNGTYFIADGGIAGTTYYGKTLLSSSTSSTSTATAATSSAVKSAYDLANGKQDALTAGTNIKNYNGASVLGSGTNYAFGDRVLTASYVGEDGDNKKAVYSLTLPTGVSLADGITVSVRFAFGTVSPGYTRGEISTDGSTTSGIPVYTRSQSMSINWSYVGMNVLQCANTGNIYQLTYNATAGAWVCGDSFNQIGTAELADGSVTSAKVNWSTMPYFYKVNNNSITGNWTSEAVIANLSYTITESGVYYLSASGNIELNSGSNGYPRMGIRVNSVLKQYSAISLPSTGLQVTWKAETIQTLSAGDVVDVYIITGSAQTFHLFEGQRFCGFRIA